MIRVQKCKFIEVAMALSSRRYRPGETVSISGQYAVVDSRNQLTRSEVTCVRGEPFPPTIGTGYTYMLVDATRHRR